MNNSIFSTYSQGENRVTATIISVFSRINSGTLLELLQRLMDDLAIELVKYENQIKNSNFKSVPDARIRGSFDYLIETKIKPNSLNKRQIDNHLKFLKSEKSSDNRLILLTPDFDEPEILNKYSDNNSLFWVNFDKLVDSISNVIDEYHFITEREKYLLYELQQFIRDENLLAENIEDKVLIIPSSKYAKDVYEKQKVYLCQPDRSFQRSKYLGFYGNNTIFKEIPKILGIIENFDLKNESISSVKVSYKETSLEDIIQRLSKLQKIIKEENWLLEGSNKLIFLSKNQAEGTVYLENDIINNLVSKNDNNRRVAYTQKQSYETLTRLKKAKFTSDLK